MTPLPPGGLYAITNARVTDRDVLAAQVAACLRGGARMLQYVRAEAAATGGASYVAFGSFFPSTTKPMAVRATTSLLGLAKAELGLPVVAIGGITPDNGRALLDAGADWLAAIDGVFGQPDIEAAARRYAALFAT